MITELTTLYVFSDTQGMEEKDKIQTEWSEIPKEKDFTATTSSHSEKKSKHLKKKSATPVIIAVGIILIVFFYIGFHSIVGNNKSTNSDTIALPTPTLTPSEDDVICTQDAFQCSDGSWVGRTGPNCEFKCP